MTDKPPYPLIASAALAFTTAAVESNVLAEALNRAHKATQIPYVVSGDVLTVMKKQKSD